MEFYESLQAGKRLLLVIRSKGNGLLEEFDRLFIPNECRELGIATQELFNQGPAVVTGLTDEVGREQIIYDLTSYFHDSSSDHLRASFNVAR